MKSKNLFFSVLMAMILTSCNTPIYYQMYRATPTEPVKLQDKFLVFEDDNCKIFYDLWDEGGNIGFRFYNKTESNIYLNLEESFFVLNDVANNYYKDRVYTKSSSTGTAASHGTSASKSVTGINYLDLVQTNKISGSISTGVMTSSGYSVTYNELKVICIPPKTYKYIAEYSINNVLFRDCALLKYPQKKQIKTLSFNKSNSPYIFSNRLEYKVGLTGAPVKIENQFYISEIGNYPEKEVFQTKNEEFCEQKSVSLTKVFTHYAPDRFYIKYGQDFWKH